MNPKVDFYVSKAGKWQQETECLRIIILDCGLDEELKWGKPCYAYEGKNVVVIQCFKEYFALLFMKGYLLNDAEGVLVKTGENTVVGRQIRFKNVREIVKMAPIVKAYIYEAIEIEKQGVKIDVKRKEKPMPEELLKKLKTDAALKKAFNTLTPGRQRGYIFHFSAPKQSKTREARIEKSRPAILKGKGLND